MKLFFARALLCLSLISVQLNAVYFSIDGNMGAGKTTLMEHIAKTCPDLVLVDEPLKHVVDVGGAGDLLEKFYTNMSDWSLAMIVRYHSMYNKMLREAQEAHPSAICLTDRTRFCTRYIFGPLYARQGTLNPLEWQVFVGMFAEVEHTQPRPNGMVYLRTDWEVALSRVAKRDRIEEKQIASDFIKGVHVECENMFSGRIPELAKIPVLILNGNITIEDDPEILKKHTAEIVAFIAKHSTEGLDC